MGASAEHVGRVAKSMGYAWCFHFVLVQNGCLGGAIMRLLDVAMFSPSFVAIYDCLLLDIRRCTNLQLFDVEVPGWLLWWARKTYVRKPCWTYDICCLFTLITCNSFEWFEQPKPPRVKRKKRKFWQGGRWRKIEDQNHQGNNIRMGMLERC